MIINTVNAFIRNSTGYLREAKKAEPGHSQVIRARYARKFLDEVGMTYSGPTPEEIAAIGPCIYVANHTSILDAVIVCAYFEGDLRILAKESLFKVPWLSTILKLEKHIKVARGKNASARNASIRENIQTAIAEGASIFFFPEGTRSPDGKLATFKHGAFFNAIQTGVPIVPIVIRGTYEAMPKQTYKITPGHCSLTLLPTITLPDPNSGSESDRAQTLATLAHDAILNAQKQG